MDFELAEKVGKRFMTPDGEFYDLNVGPGQRRAVVCGPGVLNPRYGFIWYYTPVDGKNPFTHYDAAKVLTNQFRFSLIDYRWLLLSQKKLTNSGEEIGFKPTNKILDNRSNRACLDREYAVTAA